MTEYEAREGLEQLFRVDTNIRNYEHSLLRAERLKANGQWQVKWDEAFAELEAKLKIAKQERANLEFLLGLCNRKQDDHLAAGVKS